MSIRVEAAPVSAAVGITMQEYGCRIEYNSNVRQYSEWLLSPTVYQLPQFPAQNISTQVYISSWNTDLPCGLNCALIIVSS